MRLGVQRSSMQRLAALLLSGLIFLVNAHIVIRAILTEKFSQNIRHLSVGIKSQILQQNIKVLLKPSVHRARSRRFKIDVITLPLPDRLHALSHFLGGGQGQVIIKYCGQPQHAYFDRRNMHETVVKASKG